jgi:aminoglycoside phosphotransferase (APT) family kinase protein
LSSSAVTPTAALPDSSSALSAAGKEGGRRNDAVKDRLAEYPDLGDLRCAVPALRQWFVALAHAPVLAHRDVHAHNLAVDQDSGALVGLFDFEEAAVAHRAEDFKYLPSFGPTFTEVAVDAYAGAGGCPPSTEQVGRFHFLAALEHFLFFDEDSPRWPQIVAWSRRALAAFG